MYLIFYFLYQKSNTYGLEDNISHRKRFVVWQAWKKIVGDIRYAVYTFFVNVCNGQGRGNISGVIKGGKDEVLLTFLITSVVCIDRLHKTQNSDLLIIRLISKWSTNWVGKNWSVYLKITLEGYFSCRCDRWCKREIPENTLHLVRI